MTTSHESAIAALRVPVVTRREAAAIIAARRALKAIDARATSAAAWGMPCHEARSLGRLAGTADLARDALFQTLNVAASYCESERARAACRRA